MCHFKNSFFVVKAAVIVWYVSALFEEVAEDELHADDDDQSPSVIGTSQQHTTDSSSLTSRSRRVSADDYPASRRGKGIVLYCSKCFSARLFGLSSCCLEALLTSHFYDSQCHRVKISDHIIQPIVICFMFLASSWMHAVLFTAVK